ncbi:MAG: hypothetical protein DRP76_01060 [Candidatus Omnitrophota bacterium]|nr:MAG: hypothetical protein DRP76_01060 [Candidatus Omnitrophota bacterium]RKY43696.1 MAG: hypothetical protein DRP81_06575 [Candidatus Omnitrophota bacterium]
MKKRLILGVISFLVGITFFTKSLSDALAWNIFESRKIMILFYSFRNIIIFGESVKDNLKCGTVRFFSML